jgi:hypothetical protein
MYMMASRQRPFPAFYRLAKWQKVGDGPHLIFDRNKKFAQMEKVQSVGIFPDFVLGPLPKR